MSIFVGQHATVKAGAYAEDGGKIVAVHPSGTVFVDLIDTGAVLPFGQSEVEVWCPTCVGDPWSGHADGVRVLPVCPNYEPMGL